MASAAIPRAIRARARADQVAQLYAGWQRTTISMLLGAVLLAFVLWGQVSPMLLGGWLALIVVNQGWRGLLARAWQRKQPGLDAMRRWGRYWWAGSAVAGGLWGLAAIAMFPASPAYQSLLIVCIFSVVLGGLNLTAVYRPAFYGFVLPALVPLIVRVALEGDEVHWYLALVMSVVLAFVLAFGHQVNDLLTCSLAMRYENLDLIEELRAKSRAAHEARAQAEAANHSKSQLLAAASHDLRQPLHALGLYIAALAARAQEAAWQPLVSSIQRAVAALEGQFEQLLDLSRLEAGALMPVHARISLAPLFAKVASELRPHADHKGLTLRVAYTRFAVRSDPALLERIVRNLVANAIRYTERGGVLVGARRVAEGIAIDVVDTGVGIPPPLQSRIFEEFYQVRDPHTSRAHAGLGLGLAIVRRLATLLEHRVDVTSRVERGSRFRVVAEAAAPAPSKRGCASTPRGEGSLASICGAVIAVVDDDPYAVDAMSALFQTWGAHVAGGGGLPEVLDALGRLERYPDLLVADLRLANGGNGVEVVHRLRDELGVVVPALLVSGDTSPAAERDARVAGLPLLGKPVVPAVLHAAAMGLLARV